ncbi:Txe/YoeB family addiction module toxin [Dethiobacter alkaliphilus]|uniref:Txe/YoeB family addiction module toxin n=1 Tax=Dethiobacter alkaliphilus TaxID=427926 RepID=UPI0022276842|nr:Txe/YoeB family addiction module toxin [Dethiobacter alkaliphilus]MCW3490199.1 Txe/YoeB family addiction module toxin [Dethiobacter alkaliphilus]
MSSEPWRIVYTKQALKDKRTAYEAGYSDKIKRILETVRNNPYEEYPPFEKLVGDLSGAYSRRINRQHRFVYQVIKEKQTVKVISMWTHYE